jgi:hypothetical protein
MTSAEYIAALDRVTKLDIERKVDRKRPSIEHRALRATVAAESRQRGDHNYDQD